MHRRCVARAAVSVLTSTALRTSICSVGTKKPPHEDDHPHHHHSKAHKHHEHAPHRSSDHHADRPPVSGTHVDDSAPPRSPVGQHRRSHIGRPHPVNSHTSAALILCCIAAAALLVGWLSWHMWGVDVDRIEPPTSKHLPQYTKLEEGGVQQCQRKDTPPRT